MSGFVDLHNHLMFDIDDGPASFDESKKMIDAACADGIAHIVATPHVCPGRDGFEMSEYLDKLRQMSAYCAENALPVTLHQGAEILYNDAVLRFLQSGKVPTLAGGRHVLLEFFTDISYEALFQAVRILANAGYIPVIAHVERYECLVKDISRVRELKALLPVRLQVNCSRVIATRPFLTHRFISQMLKDGAVDFVATDAHDTRVRPTCMQACYRALTERYGQAYADSVTRGNQAEIFASEYARVSPGITQHRQGDLAEIQA